MRSMTPPLSHISQATCATNSAPDANSRGDIMATILSDFLNAIRVGRSDWAIIGLGVPGALQFQRGDRAYVHFVLDGSVMLDGGELQSPVALGTGSHAIVLNGETHVVRDVQTAAASEARYFLDDHALDAPRVLRRRIMSGSRDGAQRAERRAFARETKSLRSNGLNGGRCRNRTYDPLIKSLTVRYSWRFLGIPQKSYFLGF